MVKAVAMMIGGCLILILGTLWGYLYIYNHSPATMTEMLTACAIILGSWGCGVVTIASALWLYCHSKKVQLHPSIEEFDVEEHDTVDFTPEPDVPETKNQSKQDVV